MVKIRWIIVFSLIIMLVALPLFSACEEEVIPPAEEEEEEEEPPPVEYTLYVGGAMSLTGAYAETSAAVLAGCGDYVAWVNENKIVAPWYPEKTIPDNVTFEVLWRDDELKPDKALSIYDELKAMGMLVYRTSGSATALALMDRLNEDRMGAPSALVSGPYLLSPPKTCFAMYPIYTDQIAAIAEWFMENWTEDRAPRVAYLTADAAPGRSILTPEMDEYLTAELGYELVGTQLVPMVPTTPPTTQLMWLKENKVDLALCWMINPGSQPTIKEAVRLDMGPHLGYKITFGFCYPCNAYQFCRDMPIGVGDGVVIAGSFPSLKHDDLPGVKFCNDLQDKYRPDKWVDHTQYFGGVVEAMIQVEALRLAMLEVPVEELKPVDVLEHGFYKIKNLDTGAITNTPLTYGPGDVEGINEIRIDQVWEGTYEKLGTWPCRHIYKHE